MSELSPLLSTPHSPVKIAVSHVEHGSMLDRHNPNSAETAYNRRAFLSKFGFDSKKATLLTISMLKRATVTHDTNFCRYVTLTKDSIGDGMDNEGTFIADALVTSRKGEPLILPVADCVGAVLYDPEHSILMVSHLGRHSLEQNGGKKSVHYLVDTFKTEPNKLKVWLSPAPGKASYQIWALENKGMKEATLEQLLDAGVHSSNIIDNQDDTATNKNYYSYSEFLKGNRKEDGDHMIVAVME